MTDRELLEAAAKAAGMPHVWAPVLGAMMHVEDSGKGSIWNPLTDDGDALRLVVKIQACVVIDNEMKWCGVHLGEERGKHYIVEHFGAWSDAAEATRRAIVRAAAAIGGAKL
jgi:hypothetical protein